MDLSIIAALSNMSNTSDTNLAEAKAYTDTKVSQVKTDISSLQSNKANIEDVYTKSETDTKITLKVAEIVANAPEDFDTLKEMSDWIATHESSAAEMNSAIQDNVADISNLQTSKVDKVSGKSLISDSEIERLSSVNNYDDTSIKADISNLQTSKVDKVSGKSLISDSEIERLSSVNNYDDTSIKADISNLQTSKVDKVSGKSLISDSEIERLSSVNNYDDTSIKADISSLQSNKVDKEEGKSLISDSEIERLSSINNYDDTSIKADISSLQSNKVDKEEGKGLSTNDYTTEEKEKLASLSNYDDNSVNSAIAELQTSKANIDDVYTKTETDDKITLKVSEIVANAPEDFDTLKEMSDWITMHEGSAATMNSAIQTNTDNISTLQAGKVDKETGKSLVSDSEIARLATLENYDDTAVKSDIADISSLIPTSASPNNQLADKAYVSAMQSNSPYVYMTQAEYEALTEYEPDRMYWVTYPLSKCHLIWCNGECVDGIGAENLAGYALNTSSSYTSYATCNYKYLAIAYNPVNASSDAVYPNLIRLDFAKGITSIGEHAFRDSKNLIDISIPEEVTEIGQQAFRGCGSLTTISIPDGITLIDNGVFEACSNLEHVTIPSTVQQIYSFAFSHCSKLQDIVIPEGVIYIYDNTFNSNISLKTVSLPSTITSISTTAFNRCTQSNLIITINKPRDSVSGSPWGATNATIVWTG